MQLGCPISSFRSKETRGTRRCRSILKTCRIGLPEGIYDLMSKIRANSQYRDIRGYQSMYDDETRHVIAIQFAREIELFGYEF